MPEQVPDSWRAAALDKFKAPDCVVHNLAGPDRPRDREGYRRGVVAVISGFPDPQETVEDLIAEGGRVAVRSTVRGTHKAEFAGMAPTGTSFVAAGLVRMVWTYGAPDTGKLTIGTEMAALTGYKMHHSTC